MGYRTDLLTKSPQVMAPRQALLLSTAHPRCETSLLPHVCARNVNIKPMLFRVAVKELGLNHYHGGIRYFVIYLSVVLT